MKRNKSGISLITLVITIIIMIILAGAIILTLTQSGIFDKANDAVSKYSLKEVQSIADLAWAEAFADGTRDKGLLQVAVDKALEDNDLDDKYKAVVDEKGVTITIRNEHKVVVGKKVLENSTINGEEYSATNPLIPQGFIPINTDTSKWDEGSLENNVKKGLVITDEIDDFGKSIGNEFVWIPVETISEFAEPVIINGSERDANDRLNYKGVLYDFTSSEHSWSKKGNEPAVLDYYNEGLEANSREYAERFRNTEIRENWDENYYQEQFNKMVESVKKYKGFYVARYEMSITENNVGQSKAGTVSEIDKSWWGKYESAAIYDNSQNGVVSEMIWGCQYDAMMRWMQENDIDVTLEQPFDTARGVIATRNNETIVTGDKESNDILNNVYDLLGNCYEWTQEAGGTAYRIFRGQIYNNWSRVPSGRSHRLPDDPTDWHGSHCGRMALYIE